MLDIFSNTEQALRNFSIAFIPAFLGIILHEMGHGYMALRQGDYTAKFMGRLTLNPIPHIDPVGLIMFVLTSISGSFVFGWAKPVPVNYYNIRHKYGVAIVSAAGPLANLATAFLSALLFKLFIVYIAGNIPENIAQPLEAMIFYSILINVSLFIFNLLPIMPMDGARIIWNFLPREQAEKYEATEKYYFIIILVLIVSGVLSYIITPIRNVIFSAFSIIFGI